MDDEKISLPIPAGPEGRRQWERLEYQTGMVFIRDDGQRVEGRTMDVSLGGVFLLASDVPDDIKLGQAGDLLIIDAEDTLTFPVKVVRVAEHGLGLNFSDKQAAFGMFVTHDMMLDLLTSINNAFATSLDMETTLHTSVSHIKNYLQSEAASLFLIDEDTKDVVCRACSGPVDITGTRLKMGEGIVGRAVNDGETVIVQDVHLDSYFSNKVDEATGFKTESLLCAPLRIQDKTIGALEVINKRGSGFFAGHDRVVLSALASATAMAIHNARQAEELVAKDAAVRANQIKSEFISSMSHELRTPLNAILGFAQLLQSNSANTLSGNDLDTVGHIVSGGEHLLSLINDILDLAKIENDKLSISIVDLSPDDTMEECLCMAEKLAASADVTVSREIADAPLPTIKADPVRFRQILLNLLSNAVKYNTRGGTVTLGAATTTDGMLRFTVSDTGPGIPLDKQKDLFEPFARLGHEDSNVEGTGIGLTITHKLVELMGGRIGFSSQSGRGTDFWVDLPIAVNSD